MSRHRIAVIVALALGLTACPGEEAPEEAVDPEEASGTVVLTGWQASPEETEALEAAVTEFEEQYEQVDVEYRPIPGEYEAAMLGDFAARQPPDLFYVDSALAPEWIDEGVLMDLTDLLEAANFDLDVFYDAYLDAFRDEDGGIYGLPKDGNALAMAYNVAMLDEAGVEPPTTHDELVEAAQTIQEELDVTALCLGHGLDRALAFIYQRGGALFTEDMSAPAIDEDASREAIEWYLDLFEEGLGQRAADIGVDWCGEALGRESAAIIFEGAWLDPFMEETHPDVEYDWAHMPEDQEQATLGFTVSYSIGVDSENPEGAFLLLSHLTGPEGMQTWTEGGVALPSREDVPLPEGKSDVLLEAAEYARPWSFVPGFSSVIEEFDNAMTQAIEGGMTADDVVEATRSAVEDIVR